MESESDSKKEEYKGTIIVTEWGKAGCGMTFFARNYPEIMWKLQNEDKEQTNPKDH